MGHTLTFNFPDGYGEKQLIGELADQFSIKKERSTLERIAIYDTFDWLLFNRSLVLYESGNRFFLRKLYESAPLQSAKLTSSPVFIWDFPESELKEMLAPIVKVRALSKLAEVFSRKAPYRILNQDEKIVARLVLEEIRESRDKGAPALSSYLSLKPVTGYPRYSQNLTKRLEEVGFTPRKKEDMYFEALKLVDRKPGDYSTKLHFQLDPDMRSDAAAKIILRFLLQVIRINEANIEKDLDTEFLHDFRVAIRRTRSALRQIKNVFPAEITGRFRKDFAFVGKISNQLRDLDVYLLNEATYKAMLPEKLRDHIDTLFDHLGEKRSKALREVVRTLKARKYKSILKNWDGFLHEPTRDLPGTPNAGLPVIELARRRIYSKYRRVVKDGTSILENTKDEMLHRLRIECKELRYLLEFFSSLFPPKKIDFLVEQLKKLQDNLGDFNDFSIQEQYLLNITLELPSTDVQYKKTLVAIGSLIGTLDREKQRAKEGFAATFKAFASPANKRLFKELFTGKKGEGHS